MFYIHVDYHPQHSQFSVFDYETGETRYVNDSELYGTIYKYESEVKKRFFREFEGIAGWELTTVAKDRIQAIIDFNRVDC